jgi:hypothetical protein
LSTIHSYEEDIPKERLGNQAVATTLWMTKGSPFTYGEFNSDKPTQIRGIDMYLYPESKFGKRVSAEIKNCFIDTGNLALELEEKFLATGKIIDGWFWYVEADLLFYNHIPSMTLFQLDLAGMRKEFPLLEKHGWIPKKPTLNRNRRGEIYKEAKNLNVSIETLRSLGFILAEYPLVAHSSLAAELQKRVY